LEHGNWSYQYARVTDPGENEVRSVETDFWYGWGVYNLYKIL